MNDNDGVVTNLSDLQNQIVYIVVESQVASVLTFSGVSRTKDDRGF